MYNCILVPLDGSTTAEQALPYARWLAESFRISIELLAVVDTEAFTAAVSIDRAHSATIMQEEEIGRAKNYLDSISRRLPGLTVKSFVKRGYAAEIIVEEAEKDKNILITMATHGRSGLKRWLLGSTAEKIVRGARNPVFLVRANEKAENRNVVGFKTVIVPLDGSEVAESILPSVVDLAKALNLDVVLMRSFSVPASLYVGDEGYYPIDIEQDGKQFEAEARAYLTKKQDELTGPGMGNVATICPEGYAADEITTLSQRTPGAMIAMCTHGRSGISRWAMGSVTETVVHHAQVPVLIRRAS
jgi:nucleotide-binding universal stress UspA family protein